jgi:putative transport protein
MTPFFDLLASNPLLLLFCVIGLGYLAGSARIFGFSLGVAAVLFVGLAFGAFDARLALPEYIHVLGLILFVYAVGLQSGPGFFSSFNRRGLRLNLVAVLLLGLGAVTAVVVGRLAHLPGAEIAGVFCGALTNTPALATTVETLKGLTAGQPGAAAELARPVVAYGLAYPFGVLGVILAFALFTRLFRIDFAREESERRKAAGADAILSRTFRAVSYTHLTLPTIYSV